MCPPPPFCSLPSCPPPSPSPTSVSPTPPAACRAEGHADLQGELGWSRLDGGTGGVHDSPAQQGRERERKGEGGGWGQKADAAREAGGGTARVLGGGAGGARVLGGWGGGVSKLGRDCVLPGDSVILLTHSVCVVCARMCVCVRARVRKCVPVCLCLCLCLCLFAC